ncbi:MAG: FAD-dependent oxidoreductase [Bryobacteraceae bacterium]
MAAQQKPDTVAQHIIVIGAGLSGFASAYELQRLGFRVTILEAQMRPVSASADPA